MKKLPDPNEINPIEGINYVTYVKPTIKNPNIIVGDFTYFSDTDFENHVTHHYDFYNDKLIIGKFCQIAKGVNFIMNGANHQMNAASTFPFYIFGWEQEIPTMNALPFKGDTVIGNDVWIGQDSTILPGTHIGDGAIIGANSTIGKDVEPYTIVAGNPSRVIRKRFDNEMIILLEKLQWWNLPIKEIQKIIPMLSNSNLEEAKRYFESYLKE